MKKKLIIFFLFLSVLSALFAVGCKKNGDLETPSNIRIDSDDYLRWDAVKNATSYLVIIDGEEYGTTASEIDLFDKCTQLKKYAIKIRAAGKGTASNEANFNFELSLNKSIGHKLTDDQAGLSMKVVYKDRLPSKVVIPSEINGKPVIRLDGKAFSDCDNLTAIYIPDSVKEISSSCFLNCKNLERIRLPAYLTKLDVGTFSNCVKLKNIELPASVTRINVSVFSGCKNLEKIELPSALTYLELNAF